MSRGNAFQVTSPFKPTGDQPTAIAQLTQTLRDGKPAACLLGATGTGKTFTMANVIANLGKPALIISHNKTLAAQLYEELREFFQHNSVNYFVSYYDFYQPEAYIPQRDIYIEKDSSKNEDLDSLRLAATSSVLSRRDSIVVASVSCIFGLGSPEAYGEKVLTITRGAPINRREFLLALSSMQYQRAEIEFKRGTFRVRGDALEVWPAYEKYALRLDLFGDEIERLELINPTSGEVLAEERQFFLFPAVHYVMPEDQLAQVMAAIQKELDDRVLQLRHEGKLLEAQRLIGRTKYDLEMIQEVGYCSGIENYSRFFDGRARGERPYCLMDYFDYAPPAEGSEIAKQRASETGEESERAKQRASETGTTSDPDSLSRSLAVSPSSSRPNFRDWLLIIDESHVTLPQIRAMYFGDRSRKEVLVEHGFRLPSALDNRPLKFEEFESIVPQILFVSATPGPYELERTGGEVAEQVIRPTGLLDPEIEVKPARGQVPDLVERCKERAASGERTLVTALTKRLCEDLTSYLDEQGLRVRYLHSEIETLERMEILKDLREGQFDVLVGVNLLREGLDLPEVSLVAILDADKEGFLRSPTSLIQQMGRAARNVNARVIMYADKMTPAMQGAIEETERRRAKQIAYNTEHGITPQTIIKAIRSGLQTELAAKKTAREAVAEAEPEYEVNELIRQLEGEMLEAAQSLEFEKAATLRDQVNTLKKQYGVPAANEPEAQARDASAGRGAAPTRPTSPSARSPKKLRRSDVEATLSNKPSKRPGMPGVRPRKKNRNSRG
jgi:excinuclease ABC subunit B